GASASSTWCTTAGCRAWRSTPRPMPCAPTASCSRANPPPCCPWRSATSCSERMLTVHKLLPAGQGLAPALLKRAPTTELDWDVRQKSRFDTTDSAGRHRGVFLPRGTLVRGGDVLVAEDGTLVRVVAARQPVLVVTPCPAHGSPFDLLRAAYHLGNRHV